VQWPSLGGRSFSIVDFRWSWLLRNYTLMKIACGFAGSMQLRSSQIPLRQTFPSARQCIERSSTDSKPRRLPWPKQAPKIVAHIQIALVPFLPARSTVARPARMLRKEVAETIAALVHILSARAQWRRKKTHVESSVGVGVFLAICGRIWLARRTSSESCSMAQPAQDHCCRITEALCCPRAD
jgi:hypothetical protein